MTYDVLDVLQTSNASRQADPWRVSYISGFGSDDIQIDSLCVIT